MTKPLKLPSPADAPLKTLFAFKGTALKMVLLRVDFWLLILLNLVVNIAFYLGTSGKTTDDAREEPRVFGWPTVSSCLLKLPCSHLDSWTKL